MYVLKDGIQKRINFDLTEIIVNMKNGFEELVKSVNARLEKPITLEALLFKPTDFSLDSYEETDYNFAVANFTLVERKNGTTNTKSIGSGDIQYSPLTRTMEIKNEVTGAITKEPVRYYLKANKAKVKICCRSPFLLMKMVEIFEDLICLNPSAINQYNSGMVLTCKSVNSGHKDFVAMEFEIEFQSSYIFKEFAREEWIATTVEDFTENLSENG